MSNNQEDLRLLYHVTTADLSYFKTQQWSVTNYVVLIYVALIGVTQVIDGPLLSSDRIVLALLTLVAAVGGLTIQSKLEKSISVRQSRLDSIRERMDEDFRFAWASEDKGIEYFHAIHFLRATLVLGGATLIWLAACRL